MYTLRFSGGDPVNVKKRRKNWVGLSNSNRRSEYTKAIEENQNLAPSHPKAISNLSAKNLPTIHRNANEKT